MASLGNVLITGCSVGIGRATALHLDRLGFRVFASVRRERDAAALCAESSDRLTPILMDVSRPESICAAQQQVNATVGDEGLRGVVNNAGVAFIAPFEFAPLDALRWVFDVNFFGVLAVTQAFLPLVRRAGGRIVNISSEAVLTAAPFHGPYTASKYALHGLSAALRRELKPLGVQVAVIIAGSIATPIWQRASASSAEIMSRQPPQCEELYGQRYRKVHEFLMRMGRRGIPAQSVANAIEHALTARRAKHYYLVGRDAWIYYLLKTLNPEPLQDWLTLRVLGVA